MIEGKERKISAQMRRNVPEVVVFERKAEERGRDQEGFELCGIMADGEEEWINGRSGLPEGSSLKNYKTKGKISKFS